MLSSASSSIFSRCVPFYEVAVFSYTGFKTKAFDFGEILPILKQEDDFKLRAGQPGLYEKHQRLKDSVETIRKWHSDASTYEEKAKRIQTNLKHLAPEVDNAKRCKTMREKLEQLKKKRCWLPSGNEKRCPGLRFRNQFSILVKMAYWSSEMGEK
uniref:Uncharacterized protein n=1 Tax=Romanomermis culicivorax TaxID=13658 RepID=A0A915KT25_ROMCU